MNGVFDLSPLVKHLLLNPLEPYSGWVGSLRVTTRFVIPDYPAQISAYYKDLLPGGLQNCVNQSGIPFNYNQFGLQFQFEQATELELHDNDMNLDPGVKALADQFGPVIFKNAYLSLEKRSMGHRNRFPHLSFHVDRSPMQPTPYSIFSRDPFDPEQSEPRTASTLLTANIVAYLQCVKEGTCDPVTEKGARSQYDLFGNSDMSQVLDKLVLNQAWNEPKGTGELVLQDNRTLQHASYYRDAARQGYRIGVRYVG